MRQRTASRLPSFARFSSPPSFPFCSATYGSIIYVVRRQAKLVAAQHANNPSTKTNHSLDMRIQMNAVKTMILISVAFVMCWLPCDMYILLILVQTNSNVTTSVYYTTVCFGFFNVCLNPFIYAAKYDIIKNYLSRFIKCEKNATEVTMSTNAST
jgi:7 transmembrane receptor (rhodopsin family)